METEVGMQPNSFSTLLIDLVINRYLLISENRIQNSCLLHSCTQTNRQDSQENEKIHSSESSLPLALYGVGEL